MSLQPGEMCDHDCCDTPHEPFHDHFLDPPECPLCLGIEAKRAEVRERLSDLEGAVGLCQTKPKTDEDVEAIEAVMRAAYAKLRGESGGSDA